MDKDYDKGKLGIEIVRLVDYFQLEEPLYLDTNEQHVNRRKKLN